MEYSELLCLNENGKGSASKGETVEISTSGRPVPEERDVHSSSLDLIRPKHSNRGNLLRSPDWTFLLLVHKKMMMMTIVTNAPTTPPAIAPILRFVLPVADPGRGGGSIGLAKSKKI